MMAAVTAQVHGNQQSRPRAGDCRPAVFSGTSWGPRFPAPAAMSLSLKALKARRSPPQHHSRPDCGGTLLVAAAVTGGDVTLTDVVPGHLSVVIAKLREMGAEIETQANSIRIVSRGKLQSVNKIVTAPVPGFPPICSPSLWRPWPPPAESAS